jgi:hypothetical protein
VLVVVALVGGVPMPVMHVVDVTAVRHRHMATAHAVPVLMRLVRGVPVRLALVEVPIVRPVQMPVVHEIHVATVRDRDMAAALAMDVNVAGVFSMDSHDLLVSGLVFAVTQRPR